MRAERRSSSLVTPTNCPHLRMVIDYRSQTTFVLRSIVKMSAVGLLTLLVLGCIALDASNDRGIRTHQRVAESTLKREVLPRLLAVLPAEERGHLGPVSATATVSFDPARIMLELDERKGSRLVVSTSFLLLHDALVDGSVIASATTGHEQQLIDYSVMLARFARGGVRVEQQQYPEPFWQYIGWTAARYAAFSADPRFEVLRQRASMQSLAWLGASLLSEHLYDDVNFGATNLDSQQAAVSVRQRAADLLLRARLAPVPAWSIAILVHAIRNPEANAPNQWVCGARDVLNTAMAATASRDLSAETASNVELQEVALARWRDASHILEQDAMCETSGSALDGPRA